MRVRAGVGAEKLQRLFEVADNHIVAVGNAGPLEYSVESRNLSDRNYTRMRSVRSVSVTLGIDVRQTESRIGTGKQRVCEMDVYQISAFGILLQQRLAVGQYVVGIGADFVSGLPACPRIARSVLGEVGEVKDLCFFQSGIDAFDIGIVGGDVGEKEVFVIDKVEHKIVQAYACAAESVQVREESSYGALA